MLDTTWQLWRSNRLVTVFLVGTWALLQMFTLLAATNLTGNLDACIGLTAGSCSSGPDSGNLAGDVDAANWLLLGQTVIPVLIGVFWGAPLLAREYESQTYLFAWTQDVTATRWIGQRLSILVFFSVVFAIVSGFTSHSLAISVHQVTAKSMFTQTLFEASVGLQVSYFLLALLVGFTAGAFVRKVVPALGIALFAFVAIRAALVIVRLKWFPASTQEAPFTADNGYTKIALPGENSFQLDVHYTNAAGTPVPFPSQECRNAPTAPEWEQCIRSHGVDKIVTDYQSGSHLVATQAIEIALCCAVAVLLTLLAFRHVRRATSTA
ncbi:hypothetical protein ABZU76_45345 [Amycolatopsis sp. NPDC005232]|uniref:hypothetical protein n=1 Tax=Amycolatopsis sp. NPDC005232 TaxID=3157027 RepID=UPI00339F78EC